MEFKVMNYNVLNGFHNLSIDPITGKNKYTFDAKRLENAKKVIEKENPDLLVLTEACFSENNSFGGPIIDYAKQFSYPYFYIANYSTNRGLALLSKYKILKSENYCTKFTAFCRNKISVEGKRINLDIAHPHPDVIEIDKMNFFSSILRDHQTPYLLVGDFNAMSPEDDYNRETLLKGFSKFDHNPTFTIDNFLKRLAIKEILNHGLIDTFKTRNKNFAYTIPTDFLSNDKDSGIRMDYIFASKDIKVKDSYIIVDEYTNFASDHYPLVSVLSF